MKRLSRRKDGTYDMIYKKYYKKTIFLCSVYFHPQEYKSLAYFQPVSCLYDANRIVDSATHLSIPALV